MKIKLAILLLVTYLTSTQTVASDCTGSSDKSSYFNIKMSCDQNGNLDSR